MKRVNVGSSVVVARRLKTAPTGTANAQQWSHGLQPETNAYENPKSQ